MPALTTANLVAWSLQVGAIMLAGGIALRLVRVASPRVRLAWLRTLLVVCLALPLVEPLSVRPSTASGADLSVAPERIDLSVNAAGAERARAEGEVTTASRGGALRLRSGQASSAPTVAERVAAVAARVATWAGPLLRVVPFFIAAGILARLAWLLVGLVGLARLRRDTRETTDDAIARAFDLVPVRAEVRTSTVVRRPVTFGVLRPVVLLPASFASLTDAEQTTVVCHELLHIRRRDWLQTIGEELLRAALWFHPGIWWLLAQIDLAREQRVDEQVVALTEGRQPYLNALVTLALGPAGPILRPASLFLGRAHLLQRVALLSREVRMSRPRLVASLAVVTATLILAGRLVVHACPLMAADPGIVAPPPPASPTMPASPIAQVPLPSWRDGARRPTAIDNRPSPLVAAPPTDQATNPPVAERPQAPVRDQPPRKQEGRREPPPPDSLLAVYPDADLRGVPDVVMPKPIRQSKPVYSDEAKEAKVQGHVVCEILIGATGKVEDVRVSRSADPRLNQAAIDAAWEWEFAPATKAGSPVRMVIDVEFSFHLV